MQFFTHTKSSGSHCLPPSLLLLYLPGSRGKTESEFAHVNASPNHAGGSSVPARASVPFQSSARDFMQDSWTQRIWAPQWRHSQLQHGASRDTPDNVWPPVAACLFRPTGVWVPESDGSAHDGCRMMRYILSPQPPLRDLLHKTIDISIKMEAQEVKAANAPHASALPCVIPSEQVNELKSKEGQMMS